MKNHLLTLVYGTEMAKTFYRGKWYRAGGCGYNKQESLLDRIFGADNYKVKIHGDSFSIAGWQFETLLVEAV